VNARTLGALAFTLLLAGCERKAPGPAECVAFAEIVMTFTEEARTPPELYQAQLNEHVRRCLTTPYDDELIACVAETRRFRRCLRAFSLRKELER
jgi:hypothetical protein